MSLIVPLTNAATATLFTATLGFVISDFSSAAAFGTFEGLESAEVICKSAMSSSSNNDKKLK